jgi:hypothetical protein
MGKKIIVGSVGLIIAVLAGSLIQTRREFAETKARVEQLQEQNSKLGLEIEALQVKLRGAQNKPTETVVVTAPVVAAAEDVASSETAEPKKASSRRLMRNMAKMLDNPAMNKMMAAGQRGVLDVMYEDFADQLQFNAEEKDYFMELLLARQMNNMEIGMKMMGGNLSEEEQAQLKAELKEKNKVLKEEVKYFLNSEDDVAEWKFYEKTLQDRMMLSQVEQKLGDSDAALSDQTYRQLLEAIHDERSSFDFSSNLADEENLDIGSERFSPENIQRLADDLNRLNELLTERARSILSPEQFAAFTESLTANTEMQISQMEAAAAVLGDK